MTLMNYVVAGASRRLSAIDNDLSTFDVYRMYYRVLHTSAYCM